jgi:hypothetical protein
MEPVEKDWAKTIRARNARELVAAALLAVVVVYSSGFALRSAPVLLADAWVAWFIYRYAGWQAAEADGGAGVRRELIRQGYLLMSAWIWYVLPLIVAGFLTFSPGPWLRVVFLVAGVAMSFANYRAGKRLVAEGNR